LKKSVLPASRSEPGTTVLYAKYHSDSAVSQYCEAHYGEDTFGVANFPGEMARLCVAKLEGKPKSSALDLGCAVGRASFELARSFERVTAVDLSSRFIAIARRIQKTGKLCYQRQEEGDLISDYKVSLADFNLLDTASRVTFIQGNALQLDEQLCGYDLVLLSNLIDRCPEPRRLLSKIHSRVVMGGLLVIASPYDWRDVYTSHKKWLGSFFRAGAPYTSLEGLTKILAKRFVMLGEPQDLEFVIRETARTYRHCISQVTCWRRVR
jgi:putative 4-mercaptohistidine N1-methyltranferase